MTIKCPQRLMPMAVAFTVSCVSACHAANQADAKGLWLSADKGAIMEFKGCADLPSALCGVIVWDKDAGTPLDTCGVAIARLKRYESDAWRDGWAFDPRSKKHYRAAVRVPLAAEASAPGHTLLLRAFIGTELLGQTEEMTRVSSVPSGCPNH